MKASVIIDFIPENVLEFLSAKSKVDKKVHKLSGRVMIKLIPDCLLSTRKGNLRVQCNQLKELDRACLNFS